MATRGEDKIWSREKIKERIEDNELDLSLCGISKIPVIHIIPFTKVTSLDLSCNKINTLPENFPKLQQIVHLDLSKNGITELPEDFGELVRLKRLDLFKNNLEHLPMSFHKLKSLQWLDLKANPIQESLPRLVGDCLKPAECQQCAKNIVEHYSNLYSEKMMRERRARKLEAERIAKQKQEEEQVRQRRKEEKKKRLEGKKVELNKIKNQETANGNIVKDEEETSTTSKANKSTGSCTKCFYMLLFILLIGSFIIALIVAMEFNWEIEAIHAHMSDLVERKWMLLNELKKKYSQ